MLQQVKHSGSEKSCILVNWRATNSPDITTLKPMFSIWKDNFLDHEVFARTKSRKIRNEKVRKYGYCWWGNIKICINRIECWAIEAKSLCLQKRYLDSQDVLC